MGTAPLSALLEEIPRFYELGDFEVALAKCNSATSHNAESDIAWFWTGSVLNELGRFEEASDAFRKTLDLNPSDALAWNNLAFSLYSLEKYEEAVAAARKSIQHKFDNIEAHNHLAAGLCRLLLFDEAEEVLGRVKGLGESSSYYWILRAELYLHRDQIDNAASASQRAISLDETSLRGWRICGMVSEEAGDMEKAISAWKRALDLNDHPLEELENLAYIYYRAGEFRLAREYFEKLDQLGSRKKFDDTILYLEVLLRLGDIRTANTLSKRELSMHPSDSFLLLSLAVTEVYWKHTTYVIQLVDESIASHALNGSMFSLFSALKPDEEETEFLLGIDGVDGDSNLSQPEVHISPFRAHALYLRGLSHFMDESYPAAIACFRASVDLDSTNPWRWTWLAKSYAQDKRWRDAGWSISHALHLHPNNAFISNARDQIYSHFESSLLRKLSPLRICSSWNDQRMHLLVHRILRYNMLHLADHTTWNANDWKKLELTEAEIDVILSIFSFESNSS